MKIGVPGGLLFAQYEGAIRAFFDEVAYRTAAEIFYSGETVQKTVDDGVRVCVDEVCFPIKVFCGHVAYLAEHCDRIVVFRLLRTEANLAVCPKFFGLPELAAAAAAGKRMIFTEPLFLNDRKRTWKSVRRGGMAAGIPETVLRAAFARAWDILRQKSYGNGEFDPGKRNSANRLNMPRILVLGHPYHVYDSFVNRNLFQKLNALKTIAIPGDLVADGSCSLDWANWIKKPYWEFLKKNVQAAKRIGDMNARVKQNVFDGIIYLSSFGCGTDAFTVEFVREALPGLPFLLIKLDEQTGEAGLDTRLEAFCELLERRVHCESYISAVRDGACIRKNFVSGTGCRADHSADEFI